MPTITMVMVMAIPITTTPLQRSHSRLHPIRRISRRLPLSRKSSQLLPSQPASRITTTITTIRNTTRKSRNSSRRHKNGANGCTWKWNCLPIPLLQQKSGVPLIPVALMWIWISITSGMNRLLRLASTARIIIPPKSRKSTRSLLSGTSRSIPISGKPNKTVFAV